VAAVLGQVPPKSTKSNRAGSMLDNVMYYNLTLERDMFDEALLADILPRKPAATFHVDGQKRLSSGR